MVLSFKKELFTRKGKIIFKIITIPFSETDKGFSTEELNDFIRTKNGISYKAKLIKVNSKYYWTVFISYTEELSQKTEFELKYDYENKLYEELRKWRNSKAKEEGIPPYLIYTNNQMKEIIIKKCDSKTALQEINGIGEKKSKKYGKKTLKIVSSFLENKKEN